MRQVRSQTVGSLTARQLAAVTLLVDERLARSIRVCDLAERAGVSASCFARLFKSTTGQTPHAYIAERRVKRAAELVRQGNGLSLAQIARRTGFVDQAHLTRVFRRVTGLTPARFCREGSV